eukprot:NODE_334_length_2435_cov_7.418692_g309_i0.p1 GENE.NODE_334_length_2435_cov_7.418692_g309_i0~~NODE_334_length_2435_cov_7.418692_g309_i0.p1  ORF type:complete len:655 (+),score=118.60 NODE_334_length_2435_cov_7.418692_g309_i0:122-2086(+)
MIDTQYAQQSPPFPPVSYSSATQPNFPTAGSAPMYQPMYQQPVDGSYGIQQPQQPPQALQQLEQQVPQQTQYYSTQQYSPIEVPVSHLQPALQQQQQQQQQQPYMQQQAPMQQANTIPASVPQADDWLDSLFSDGTASNQQPVSVPTNASHPQPQPVQYGMQPPQQSGSHSQQGQYSQPAQFQQQPNTATYATQPPANQYGAGQLYGSQQQMAPSYQQPALPPQPQPQAPAAMPHYPPSGPQGTLSGSQTYDPSLVPMTSGQTQLTSQPTAVAAYGALPDANLAYPHSMPQYSLVPGTVTSAAGSASYSNASPYGTRAVGTPGYPSTHEYGGAQPPAWSSQSAPQMAEKQSALDETSQKIEMLRKKIEEHKKRESDILKARQEQEDGLLAKRMQEQEASEAKGKSSPVRASLADLGRSVTASTPRVGLKTAQEEQDEALARILQEEEERKTSGPSSRGNSLYGVSAAPPVRGISKLEQETADEILARKLQEEEGQMRQPAHSVPLVQNYQMPFQQAPRYPSGYNQASSHFIGRAPSNSVPSGWSCQQCTLQNALVNRQCSACGAPNPHPPPVSAVPAPAAGGPPEWVPDNLAVSCMNDRCGVAFSMIERRHHCRACGLVFCSKCTSRRGTHGGQRNQRLCDRCYPTSPEGKTGF